MIKKLFKQLKSGLRRTIKWNKYKSQMSVQSNNNNSNDSIDRTFTDVNRLFVLSFQRIAGEIIQQEIIEILFQTIMYQTLK